MTAACPRFGFIVTSGPTQNASALAHALTERLTAHGLEVDASHGGTAIVITREGSQATESDRQFVIGVLNELSAAPATVSDLVDLNY